MKLKRDFKKNYPFLLFLLCCIAFVLFFNDPINNVLNTLLVKPLFSKFYNTIFSNIILALLSIGIAIWLIIYGETKFLRTISLLTIVLYCLILNSGYWNFQHSILIPIMLNWNYIVLSLILPALKTIIKSKPHYLNEQNDKGFIEDRPIDSIDNDSFKRSIVAKEIANKISITYNLSSFAIGILGEYGSGKTSFINLIKTSLNKTEIEILDFNPWSSDKYSNIQRDFFDLLASKIYKLNPKISNLIIDYSRKLSRIDSSIEKGINKLNFTSNLFKSGNFSDDFEKINELLKTCSKKVVVTIDDLDRLYDNEVVEVLRLIRNTANFTNICYLVAYERSYINAAIKSINPNADSSYLDKIIQLEIPLPKRENDDLINLLTDKLRSFVTDEDMNAFTTHIISYGFKNEFDFSFKGVFRQSRDVIRFVNNLKITYSLLGTEVLFESLFVLELIKLRFPPIYDRLYEHRDDFIHKSVARSSHDQFYELRTYKEDTKDAKDTLIIVKKLRNENHYNESEITLIAGLVNNLFSKFDRNNKAKNSIIYPMFFDRYFRYRLSGTEISEKSFQEAKNQGLQSLKDFIDQCMERNLLSEVSTRIFQEKPNTKIDFELKVESLFYLGPKHVELYGKTSFDTSALIDLIWNYNHEIDKKFYNNNENSFDAFIEKMFAEATFPYLFHHNLLYHIKDDSRNISIIKDKIVGFQVNYFKEYVSKNNLSDDAIWMFWWTRFKEFVPLANDPNRGHNSWHFEEEIIPVIKKFLINYDPIHFLKYSIEYDFSQKDIFRVRGEILGIFDNPECLRKLVLENRLLSSDAREEYLEFFDACKTKNFTEWVRYEFNTSLKRGIKD